MISVEQTEQFASLVEQQLPVDDAVVSGLRQAFPDYHFTYCMDDDIVSGKPVIERETFNLYLIDGREHCLCLTNDHEVATGVVVAELVEEDD